MASGAAGSASLSSLGGSVPSSARGPQAPLRLRLLERSLSGVGLEELERTTVALSPETPRAWFESESGILELALLRTCQRVVVLALVRDEATVRRLDEHLEEAGPWTAHSGEAAVRRLYYIASGLDSRARGEREIRDQVRSTASGVLSRHARPVLRNLLHGAAGAAESLPEEGRPSVADLAVRWVADRLGPTRQRVLVIGGGVVGRRVAEGLSPRHTVVVVYRSRPPSTEWAERCGVQLRDSARLPELLSEVAAVVAAAKTTGRLLAVADVPTDGRTRYFVDLGVPRNLDPRLREVPGAVLVDLEGLPPDAVEKGRLASLRRRVIEASEAAVASFGRSAAAPAVAEVWRRAERIREAEWEGALQRAGDVSPQARFAFETLSKRLVRQLLAGPARELRERGDRGAGRRSRRATRPAPVRSAGS